MWAKTKRTPGFTIVELLIVIVVIGILAAITIVAYSGIQQKARDAARTSSITQLQKALEFYYIDNGSYPSLGTDNIGYDLSNLAPMLVPKYLARLPTTGTYYQYVRGPVSAVSYGILMYYELKPNCSRGVNHEGTNWWAVPAC